MNLILAWTAIALIAGGLSYRWRHRVLRLCALVVGTAIALALAMLLTGDYAPELFWKAARIFTATVLLSILAVLLVGRSLPQLVSKHDRHTLALVFAAIVTMYLAIGGFLAVAATEELQLSKLPRVQTRDEFIEWRDSPVDPGGMLLQARISGVMPELEGSLHRGVVASYRCPTLGPLRLPTSAERLPARYLLDLAGGPPIVADGIESSDLAWAWPSPADSTGECVLHRGDPVVVWGIQQPGMGAGGPTSYTGMTDVRKIAAGDIRSFLDGYLPVAQRTGRAVLALALLNVLLAAAMAAIGVRSYRHLARAGTDAPAKITWRSGPR